MERTFQLPTIQLDLNLFAEKLFCHFIK